jgi:hypothetical protein
MKSDNEILQYEVDSRIHILEFQEALSFWDTKKTLYPVLNNMAKDYFSIPISSAFIERKFSVGGLIFQDYHRANLSFNNFRNLILLNDWQKFF